MALGPRRPRFYFGVLVVGFVRQGFLSAFMETFFPPNSPTRSFFTYAVHPGLDPVRVNLLVLDFTTPGLVLNVSILSLVGVVIAYYAARSLF